MDALVGGGAPAAAAPAAAADDACTIDLEEHVLYATTSSAIDSRVDFMRSQLEVLPASHHVLSLDAEWEIQKNTAGFQTGRGRVDMIQIGYRLADNIDRALLLKVTNLRTIPPRLLALFNDLRFSFVGRGTANDMVRAHPTLPCCTTRSTWSPRVRFEVVRRLMPW